ncbi:MAG: hypothetical protein JNM43_23820 [Planctomycetaceae bacterium]|nr:hypothetical protein [Planctomycetaceae bacterium]
MNISASLIASSICFASSIIASAIASLSNSSRAGSLSTISLFAAFFFGLIVVFHLWLVCYIPGIADRSSSGSGKKSSQGAAHATLKQEAA